MHALGQAFSKGFYVTLVLLTLSPSSGQATSTENDDPAGTLTQVLGDVKIFSHPSAILQKSENGVHVLYQGEYFLANDAQRGDRVEKGNIVRTAPGAKARVVFNNGDQINVSPSTSYRINWNTESKPNSTEIQLAYGKLRGIIEKGGPRSHLHIKTKSAVMGVRGTDFFISYGGRSTKPADQSLGNTSSIKSTVPSESFEATEITILRGSVEVTPRTENPTSTAATEIKAGFSAKIEAPQVAASSLPVEMRQATQIDFSKILQASSMASETPASARSVASEANHQATTLAHPSLQTQNDLKQLEQKAVTMAMKDIQQVDPQFFNTLTPEQSKDHPVVSPEGSVEDLNRVVVQGLAEKAPRTSEDPKPGSKEFENLHDAAYDKYFKNYR